MLRIAFAFSATLAMFACFNSQAHAAQCGSSSAGFAAWKQEFAGEARAKGVSAPTIQALMATNYAQATINADRGQRSFQLSLDQFLAKRGAATIVAKGRQLKASQGALFASINERYGVPPGPLLAIWGMETGFGTQRGNQNMLASIATLAYDCRRSAYFTEHLYAALQLIDRGALSASQRGSMHGEVGQTQFMPKAILAYGTGNLENSANALTSTANFLKAHGWRAGAGYQPGEPNFAAIQAWNAAGVYQKAIALMGRQIDGGPSRGFPPPRFASDSCHQANRSSSLPSAQLRTGAGTHRHGRCCQSGLADVPRFNNWRPMLGPGRSQRRRCRRHFPWHDRRRDCNKGFACAYFVGPFSSAPSSAPPPLTPPAAAAISTPSWRRCRRRRLLPASRRP